MYYITYICVGDSRQNVPGYQGPYNEGPQVLKEPYSDGLSSHQLYPGMYFPPQGGQTKNPFNYDFTIGIRQIALLVQQFSIKNIPVADET
jgi:hypothetical protein